MPQLAQDSRRILEKTFPSSPYLTGSSTSKPWWNPFTTRDTYKGVDVGTDASSKPWWQWW
jgi:hypothetical protein